MAINIPGLSLSILRQQTTVQAGLPLLISGRFTAFGMGVPTFIKVFLEGPSYDPQIRSFDTFASPFSGDYSTNIIAEKDGQYNVYAQAFPPPLIPSGPPFPEALMLLPPFAESTRPPLVVGYPFNGGVDALLPDGTRQRLTAPEMLDIEITPIITIGAPAITFPPGVPTMMPFAPPPAPPYVPPPAPPVAPELIYVCPVCRARFSTLGELELHRTVEHPAEIPVVTYPLYVDIVGEGTVTPGSGEYLADFPVFPTATPAPGYAFDSWSGDVSGTIPVVSIMMDSPKSVTAYFIPIPVEEVVPPKLPTLSGLGAKLTPSEATVGDVVNGTINWLPSGPVPFTFGISADLMDSAGQPVMNILRTTRTADMGVPQTIPFSFDTTGLAEGWYGLGVSFSDPLTGLDIAAPSFPYILSLLPLPEIIPAAPTLPTADMFGTPSVEGLPTQLEIGQMWQGNISIPTYAPPALMQLPSLPALPVNIGLQLQDPTGQAFDVVTFPRTFTPGQDISLPVNFDTSVLTQEGMHDLILNITDLQGNTLFPPPGISGIIGSLLALMPALPKIPTPPALPKIPALSKFTAIGVELVVAQVQVGQSITIPISYTHVGARETVTLYAAIGDDRPAYMGGLDEVWDAQKTIDVGPDPTPNTRRDSVTIQITPVFQAAGRYSVYAKITGRGFPAWEVISATQRNILEVVAPAAPPPPPPAPPVVGASQFTSVRISPEPQQVTRGVIVGVSIRYTHQGAAETETLYAAIGNAGAFGFDEILSGQKAISVPDDPEPVERWDLVDIPITEAISPGTYALYAKVGRVGYKARAISEIQRAVVYVT